MKLLFAWLNTHTKLRWREEREHETDERSMTRNKLSYDGIVLCTLDEAGLSKASGWVWNLLLTADWTNERIIVRQSWDEGAPQRVSERVKSRGKLYVSWSLSSVYALVDGNLSINSIVLFGPEDGKFMQCLMLWILTFHTCLPLAIPCEKNLFNVLDSGFRGE